MVEIIGTDISVDGNDIARVYFSVLVLSVLSGSRPAILQLLLYSTVIRN